MEFRFDGKRGLVTGAGKGIGRDIAKALCEAGAETTALSRTQEDLDSIRQECPDIHTVCVDLADWDATRKAIQELGAIDLLVNNACHGGLTGGFLDTMPDSIDRVFEINVNAVFNVSQVVAKGMVERGQGGCIVNISSMSSKVVWPHTSILIHVSKAALDQLTRVMALELGPHQIRVNAVNPSFVKTPKGEAFMKAFPAIVACTVDRTPQKKCVEVTDVVHPVLYLLSDKSDMITGSTLVVDGGFTIC